MIRIKNSAITVAIIFGVLGLEICFAQGQLGTVTDLHHQESTCPTGFTCSDYTVSTPYNTTILGRAAILNPNVPVVATDVFFGGANGAGYWQGLNSNPTVQPFWFDLSAAGHRIIQWAWSQTWSIDTFNGIRVYNRIDSDRAATVIAYFQNYYGGRFNVVGSSWGSGEVAFAIANWPITVDRAFIVSGPVAVSLAQGCETNVRTSPYYYGSDACAVDLFMGLGTGCSGPCATHNMAYDQIWQQNTVEYGGIYLYPNTGIRIYLGQNDTTDIKNRGMFYEQLLQQAGQQDIQLFFVPNCGHNFEQSPVGLAALESGLLSP
jgi:pimeloyl-ACP methyl ester carboxylesterase